MTPAEALAELEMRGDAERAAGAAAYHKAPRRYLGVPVPEIDALSKQWRPELTLDERVALADGLWQSDVHEARVAAARLLTQARIRPDDAVWALIVSWVPQLDAWAIADHAAQAGSRRLVADPARLDLVETWLDSPILWTRRAALVFTLPWTKLTHPKPAEIAARERILGWAARLGSERPSWFEQKAVAWWLRDLSRHDPDRVRAFLDAHGDALKPFARKEAEKYL
ncbi:DNA alkylation repair protein [Acidimangrovimonas sediminis]|uniref:DNA alkylation repair protein n=1 Tax=Acidimangrovimonas sediminis TaxID=2056283 RepID=UPI000C806887|nr:DNA alkylation repair protein [Acidimangrovimonas sediminis]